MFSSLCYFLSLSSVHLQHAGQVPGQQPTRSQQLSCAIDDTLDWSGLRHWRPSNYSSSQSVVLSHTLPLLSSTFSTSWLQVENQMCFCWSVEAKLLRNPADHQSYLISQDLLFLRFPQSLTGVYYFKSHWCWELIWNSDVMEPGLTFTLQFNYFYFVF